MRRLAFAITLLTFAATLTAAATPIHLRTEQQTTPLALDTPTPHFSWQSDVRTPNWMQSAYRLTLTAAAKPFWQSDKIASSSSLDIAYTGPALQPQTRYTWTVTVWDSKGIPATSAPTWFETGLKTWSAQWIGRDDPQEKRELASVRFLWLPGSNPLQVPGGTTADLRYTLHLDTAPNSASLHITSRGRFTASVNGHVTGSHDEWSAFDYEQITPLLHLGDNEILIHVVAPGNAKQSGHAATAAILRLTDAAGHDSSIVTDKNWQARPSDTAPWQPALEAGPITALFSVGVDRGQPIPGPSRVATSVSLLRKPFRLRSPVQSARLTITALGAYRAFLNGQPVAAAQLLQPGFTDFNKRALFQTFDVTTLLQPGANVLGAMLGGGWHSSPLTWTGNRFYPGPDLLRAQLDITFADGTHRTIATDNTWQSTASPIPFAEIYGGEVYDARLATPNWTLPTFNASTWQPALRGQAPAGLELTAMPDLPVASSLTLHPVSMSSPLADSPTVFDMGQNMVGNISLHLHGPRGTVITLRYAERLNPDGSIYTANLRNAEATDIYILSGALSESYTPSFTFHGFRYVEVSGNPAPLNMSSIDGHVQNSLPLAPSIRFRSSSQTLNDMSKLGIWGQRGNFLSIPTDCPQRDERLGWMGDAGVFWRTGTFNFDIASFTHKFMLDITDAQTPGNSFTDISPDFLGRDEGAPGWADAGIFIPYAAWLQYGDTALLQQSWPAMQRYMQFIESSNPDHLRKNKLGANYGDWLAPDPNTPRDLIATAYWALVARDMSEMATALHRPQDVAAYNTLYQDILKAYQAAYINPDGSVKGNTQTAYAATLFAGLAPAALKPTMTDRLAKDIAAHDGHLTTGFLGTPLLLPALAENGHADTAFQLLLQTTYPSWGYMVAKGATTWWERWNGDTGDPSMNSYNHYAFGSVMAWVFRSVAGIDTDPSGAGFQHLTIHPNFSPTLPQVHAEYDSAYGTITTDYNAARKTFTVTTPPNTTATIVLPTGTTENIQSGTHTYKLQ